MNFRYNRRKQGCKPFPGGFHVQFIPQHPEYTSRLAVYITLDTNMRKFLGYLVWLFCLAGNGFMLFLLGLLSSNATGPPKGFFLASLIGAGLPVILSMYFVSKEKFDTGSLLTFLTIPLVLFLLFVMGLT
jgi:uncharacterized membrane protein YiaA